MAATSHAGDWAQLQGNAAKTGVNASERLIQLEPTFTLDVLGAGTDTQINLAGPVVIGDTVYVGANNGWITAVSRQTGTVNWSIFSDGAVRATPGVFSEAISRTREPRASARGGMVP
ncbi:MAG: PQQ-binding-like beta-propeller repeat protein, partial [Candidatus Coatesbacteria bacterium]